MYLIESQKNVILYLVANKTKMILGLVIFLLILGNVVFGSLYFLQAIKMEKAQKELEVKRSNDKILSFFKTFIDKVLKSDKEVSFRERLKLENEVRDLNDKDILAQWEKFISSATEQEAQKEVTNLLDLLINKVYF